MLRHLDYCVFHEAGERPSAEVRKSSKRSLEGDAGTGAIGGAQTVPRFTLAGPRTGKVAAHKYLLTQVETSWTKP